MGYLAGLCLVTFGLSTGWLTDAERVCIVPKCCPPHQSIPVIGKGCQNTSLEFEPEFWNGTETVRGGDLEPLHVVVGDPCQYGKFRLEPELDSSDEFHILCNGSLLVPFLSSMLYKINHYCLETFRLKEDGDAVTLPLLCCPPDPPPPTLVQKVAMAVYPVGLLISVPFLVLTAVVFTGIPELCNTQGKSLSCHCVSLALAYISLATVQLIGGYLSTTACITLAFVIQVSFVSCFFWLNVLCIDTWWRINQKLSLSPCQERNRFLCYSLYAWSLPLLLTMGTLLVELTRIVPNTYLRPNIGVQSCWFQSKNAAFPYFYTPIGILLIINIWLLYASGRSLRATKEQRAEEEPGLGNAHFSKAHRRIEMFQQSLILFLVMSLNWVLELLSYLISGPVEVCIITDTLNALQGLIIYFVFIVRVQRVRELASTNLVPVWGGLCGQHPTK